MTDPTPAQPTPPPAPVAPPASVTPPDARDYSADLDMADVAARHDALAQDIPPAAPSWAEHPTTAWSTVSQSSFGAESGLAPSAPQPDAAYPAAPAYSSGQGHPAESQHGSAPAAYGTAGYNTAGYDPASYGTGYGSAYPVQPQETHSYDPPAYDPGAYAAASGYEPPRQSDSPAWQPAQHGSAPGYYAPGYPQQYAAPAPPAPRTPRDRASDLRGVSVLAGLLALVFSFFPWAGPTIEIRGLDLEQLDISRGQLDQVLDRVRGITASAWDLHYASRSIVLAVVAALLVLLPAVEPRLRGAAWPRLVALGASALSLLLLLVQVLHGAGVLGNALDQLSQLADLAGGNGSSVGIGRRWAAFVAGALVLIQFVCLLGAQLRAAGVLPVQRPDGEHGATGGPSHVTGVVPGFDSRTESAPPTGH